MRQPKQHAELIKAWADGARIQCKDTNGIWYFVEAPSWSENIEYRIHPFDTIPQSILESNFASWSCTFDDWDEDTGIYTFEDVKSAYWAGVQEMKEIFENVNQS